MVLFINLLGFFGFDLHFCGDVGMKSITALKLLKRHKLVHKDVRLQDLKKLRRMFRIDTWPDYIRYVMQISYLSGKRDLSNPIIIPEVQFAIGGTQCMHCGKLYGENENHKCKVN